MDITNYDVIKEAFELDAGRPSTFKMLIGKLYALILKEMSKKKDRDINILLTDIQALGYKNKPYCEWQENYNSYNAKQYDDYLKDNKKYCETIKNLKGIHIADKKNKYRRAKKLTSRIYNDIKKVCLTYKISSLEHNNFCVALKVGHLAYREAIINLRYKLHPDSYREIPDGLHIQKDSKRLIIKDLYRERTAGKFKYYQLDSEIKLTKEDIRNIQLAIYPYIFKNIYKSIRF